MEEKNIPGKARYKVRLYYTAYADFEVEAENKSMALRKAFEEQLNTSMLRVFERMPECDTVKEL